MIFKGFTRTLVEQRGYPSDLLKIELDISFLCKQIVYHIPLGNFLQLSYDGKILKGFHGTRELNNNEINTIYNDKIINNILEGIRTGKSFMKDNYWFLATDFDIPHMYLTAKLIDMEDRNKTKNYKKILDDIYFAVEFNYNPVDMIEKKAHYFKYIENETEKYVRKRNELKEKIKKVFYNNKI